MLRWRTCLLFMFFFPLGLHETEIRHFLSIKLPFRDMSVVMIDGKTDYQQTFINVYSTYNNFITICDHDVLLRVIQFVSLLFYITTANILRVWEFNIKFVDCPFQSNTGGNLSEWRMFKNCIHDTTALLIIQMCFLVFTVTSSWRSTYFWRIQRQKFLDF